MRSHQDTLPRRAVRLAGALTVAARAARHGVALKTATWIALACNKHGIRYSLGFGLVEHESNFEHIYGHDGGGLYPGQRVTRSNYRQFRRYVIDHDGSGANGVGLTQITYWTYIKDHAGLWKKRANLFFGLGLIADNVEVYGERKGLAVYNGGPGNPQYDYADGVLAQVAAWRAKIKK